MQWQEAVKVLVKPLSDSFQAKVELERFRYPSQFADFFLSHGSTVSAPCQNNSIFAFSVTVVLSSFIVNVVSSIRHETDFKSVELTKEMSGYYKEYG